MSVYNTNANLSAAIQIELIVCVNGIVKKTSYLTLKSNIRTFVV